MFLLSQIKKKKQLFYLSIHFKRQFWWNTCPQGVMKMSSVGKNMSLHIGQFIFIFEKNTNKLYKDCKAVKTKIIE